MDGLPQFTKLLFRQWWFAAIALLGLVSTLATFLPAYYARFAVSRWAILLALVAALYIASFRVYKAKGEECRGDIAELRREISALSVKPYDEQKRAAAEQILNRCSIRQRDLLRWLLVRERPTAQRVQASTKLSPAEVSRDIQDLERDDIVHRDEDHLQGIIRFFVDPVWVPVFRDLLFPRKEQSSPPFYD
jgi:hypothetical protein